MDIGTSIKKLRMKNGITQQQLADQLSVSMQTISRWETSATYPDIVMLPVLARYFRVSVDSLLDMGGKTMKPIESERLLIREWKEDDAPALLEAKRKESHFVYYMKINTEDDALQCLNIWKEYREIYPVILKETGALIGIAGLVDLNRYKGYKELEVHIRDPYNNVDYVTEAHKLMLGYGFGELGLLVASSYCGCDDDVLKQALIDTGFVYEGTLRRFGRDKNDRMRYSILQEEFRP